MQFIGFKSAILATKITKDHQLTNTEKINRFTTKFIEHDTLIQYINYKDLIITLLQFKSVRTFIDNNGNIKSKQYTAFKFTLHQKTVITYTSMVP